MNKWEIEELIKKEAGDAVKATVVGAVELEKRKLRKERRKKFFKRLWKVLSIAFWVCVGFMLCLHKDVIKAYIKGEKLPPIPKNHPNCPCLKFIK